MTISPTSKDNTKNGIGYLLAFAIPGIIVASVVPGRRPGWADYMAFALIIIAFCVVPTVSVLKLVPDGPPCRRFEKHIAGRYVHLLPIIAFPIQILVLAIGVAHSINPGMGPLGIIGWLLSVGLFSALFGITASHELIHRRSKFARVLGGILLSTACFGCFKVVHIRLHHRYVGTDHDFASADRGDSIYAFWLRALIGNPREAVRLEQTDSKVELLVVAKRTRHLVWIVNTLVHPQCELPRLEIRRLFLAPGSRGYSLPRVDELYTTLRLDAPQGNHRSI